MSHTPGPWKIHFYDDITKCPRTVNHAEGEPSWEYLHFQIATKQADRFAEVIVGEVQARNAQNGGWPTVNDWDECRANARLIAAAPEMLEALIEAAGHLTAYIEAEYCDHHGRGLCQCKPDIVARLTNLIRRAKGDAA